MNPRPVEILLVKDNPSDAELALYALKKHNLANHIHIVRDGAEALDFIFCAGDYAGRRMKDSPSDSARPQAAQSGWAGSAAPHQG